MVYSTALDYLLVTLMDHCPLPGQARAGAKDPVLKWAFLLSSALAIALGAGAAAGPATLRPALVTFAVLVLLMAVGAGLGSRRIWLLISLVNNLALLLFFKYAALRCGESQPECWAGCGMCAANCPILPR